MKRNKTNIRNKKKQINKIKIEEQKKNRVK